MTAASHFNMIDVGDKAITQRIAIAQGRMQMNAEAFQLIKIKKLPKGDPLPMAEVAGILAAKKTAELLPLCHPLPLDQVSIEFELEETTYSIWVYCTAKTHAKTGVEMEALVGVQTALLTLYDLTKPIDPALLIQDICLREKHGGKSGVWLHPHCSAAATVNTPNKKTNLLRGIRAAVITASDRASKGQYEDKSGPLLQQYLENSGAEIVAYEVIADDAETIREKVLYYSDELRVHLLAFTGGTGVTQRDVTPETVAPLCDRLIPGIGELLRSDGARYTAFSWLSRSMAGIRGSSLIITLPGSAKAVAQGLPAIETVLSHILRLIKGYSHE